MYSDVYNTTVNVNGNRLFSSTFYPGYGCGCCGGGMFMNSCFGYGYNGGIGAWLGMGLGYAAGMALVPAMPGIFKGIAKGAKAVAKGVSNLWNKIFHKTPKAKAEKA